MNRAWYAVNWKMILIATGVWAVLNLIIAAIWYLITAPEKEDDSNHDGTQ